MSTPDQPTPPTTAPAPEEPGWTDADRDAVFASAFWFDSNATPELIDPYRGMHVAILGERIIDADRDRSELCRRITEGRDTIPIYRVLIRYIPTEEEVWSGRW
jgi:hypothetical protein